MKKVLFFAALALSVMMVSCNKAENPEAKPASEDKAAIQAQPSEGLEAIRIAMDLARYGYKVESADALLKAADILVSTPVKEMDNPQIEKSGEKAEGDDKRITIARLLDDAKDIAGEDEHLLALAADIEKKIAVSAEGTRGAVGGPVEHYDRISGQSYDLYTIGFKAEELAEIAIIGDGDTDLDLYVYDENGNLVESDTSYSGNCYVSFSPRWTGNFSVKVINRGNIYNDYVLLTN